jgi:hypothetical protein
MNIWTQDVRIINLHTIEGRIHTLQTINFQS